MPGPDILTVAADPKFQALPESDQHAILGHLDPNFAALPDEDKPQVLETLQRHALTRPDLVAPPGIARPQVNMRMSPLGKGYEGPGAHDIPGSFEGHPDNIGEWPVAGPGEIAGGVKDIAQGQIARGGHRVISGAGNTVMPFAPFAAVAAPLATARAVSGGYIGGSAAEAGADALNLSPDQKALAGDVGNLVAGGIAAEPSPFIRGTGRVLTARPRAAFRSLAERMRNFGAEPPAAPPNPFRDVPDPEADVFREPPPQAAQTAPIPQRPVNVRGPGEIPPEMIRPRAYTARPAEPLPPRSGLALPPGPQEATAARSYGAGPLAPEPSSSWFPPEEFHTPFQRQSFGGFGDVQEDAGIEQDIASRVENEGQRISANESRRAWAANSPAVPKGVLVEQMGGKTFEKPVNLKPYPPAEAPTVEAQPTKDYPRLVEKVKASPRSRPKLVDQLKAQQASPDEDLTPLLQKSLEEALKRKR